MTTPVQIHIGDELYRHYSLRPGENSISILRMPLLDPGSRIFTFGSCFAEEIKREFVRAAWNGGGV